MLRQKQSSVAAETEQCCGRNRAVLPCLVLPVAVLLHTSRNKINRKREVSKTELPQYPWTL